MFASVQLVVCTCVRVSAQWGNSFIDIHSHNRRGYITVNFVLVVVYVWCQSCTKCQPMKVEIVLSHLMKLFGA